MKFKAPKGTPISQRFWMRVWNIYDTPLAARFVTGKIAPWLFGKAVGSCGERVS